MKLKNILIPFLALAAMVGCTTEDPLAENFSEVSIEPSYVGFTAEGGSIDAEVTASVDWAFDPASLEAADWLEVDPISGAAGTTPVKFTVKKNEGSSKFDAELKVVAGGKTQFVKVSQAGGAGAELVITSVKDVLNAEVGQVFNVEGVVSNIVNTLYGNLDITDETGTIFIYGFLDKNGESKHFSDLKIEDGDRIIINGPRSEHNGKAQMKDVSLVKIVKKSLIKLESSEFEITKDAQEVLVKGSFKSNDINVENNNDWIIFKGVNKDGENATITFSVAENTTLAKRTAKIILKSGEDAKTITISQEPRPATPEDILNVSVKDVLEANTGKGGPFYRVSGMIKNIAMDKDHKDKQDAKGKFTLVDGTGEIYVYGLTATDLIGKDCDYSFPSLGLKNGDFVTIVGARDEYKGKAQLAGPAYHVSHDSATKKSIKDFLNGEVGDRAHRAILTGTVANLQAGEYGNFDLIDENGDKVYVYGLVNGPSYYEKEGQIKFSNNKSFPTLGITEGAKITIVSVLGDFRGKKQAVESYLHPDYKVIPGGDVKPDPEKPGEATHPFESHIKFELVSSAYADDAKINGKDVKVLKLGTSKNPGTATLVNIPMTTSKIGFYALAWKDKEFEITLKNGDTVLGTITAKANDGASGSAPYTIDGVTDANYYVIETKGASTIEISSAKSKNRGVIFGINSTR